MGARTGESAADRRAVEVTVVGQVQGVGFRYHTQAQAESLGVAGWVRNEPDGTVVGHLEGEVDAVDALVAWLRHGPPSASVTNLDVREAADDGATTFRTH